MSFSASWDEVRKTDLLEDLSLAAGKLSPPLEDMSAEVEAVAESCSEAATGIIDELPNGPSGKYKVSAYGHVRQDETDQVSSTVTVMINEKAEETVT